MVRYARCEECKQIIKKEDDDTIRDCPYCGSKMGFVPVSEREWRGSRIGVLMQPLVINTIKPSIQTTWIKELIE